jgi:hypothetical protein
MRPAASLAITGEQSQDAVLAQFEERTNGTTCQNLANPA